MHFHVFITWYEDMIDTKKFFWKVFFLIENIYKVKSGDKPDYTFSTNILL